MLNPSIAQIPMPGRVSSLPVDPIRGYPVPWFVARVDGKPEFRCMEGRKLTEAIQKNLCWVCGQTLGKHKVFVIGPMCSVNRITAEPPCHKDCAEYSAKACPFLTRPDMERREGNMPEGNRDPAGIMIARNPGVTCLWNVSKQYRIIRDGDGVLFRLPDPDEVQWFCQGRTATRAEVDHSIDTGLPLLRSLCFEPGSLDALAQMVAANAKYLPAA